MVNLYLEPRNDCHKPRADGWVMHVFCEPRIDIYKPRTICHEPKNQLLGMYACNV